MDRSAPSGSALAMPAAEALHQLMHLSVDYVATKRGLALALGLMVNESSELYGYSIRLLTQATALLVRVRSLTVLSRRCDGHRPFAGADWFFLRQSSPGSAGQRPAFCRYLYRWPQVQDVSAT
jgi:hypothetical protein